MIKGYNVKAKKMGHVIRFYEYEQRQYIGRESEGGRHGFGDPDRTEEYIKTACQRRRNNVIELALCNFDSYDKFATFTYREHVTNIDIANKDYKEFIQRMRYKYGAFPCLTVIEFTKKGRIHYHMLAKLPYIKKSLLAEIWGHGFVKINRITHVDNIGAYIVKYMTKEGFDERLKGRKMYLCSKGLKRSEELIADTAEELKQHLGLEDKTIVFKSDYWHEFTGQVAHAEYNPKRTPKGY